MRMRHKPNLVPRMEKCSAVLINEPEKMKGTWRKIKGKGTVYLELGCGKGRFTADTAETIPDILLLAVERVPDALVTAMERVCKREIDNVRFICADVVKLNDFFTENEVDRIFINFCDPWPKSRDAKMRLTAPGFLRMYADLLPVGGRILFKTDNTPLFDWSCEQMQTEGWELQQVTHDLHANGPVGIMTDYEAKFYESSIKINRLEAVKTEKTLGKAAGPVPRLRNAALSDARGE